MLPDIDYGLAEEEILSQPRPAASTLPDVLARPAVLTPAAESAAVVPRKVVIRKRGPEVSVELQSFGALPRSFVKAVETIAQLLTLPPGWNSYSAKPIAPQNAICAIRLVSELLQPTTPPPVVVPRVRGGLQLEWHTEAGDIEIYIDSPDRITFFAENSQTGESTELPLAANEEILKAWIQRIAGK